MEWHVEDTAKLHLGKLGSCPPGYSICNDMHWTNNIYGVVSPIERLLGYRNQQVETGVAPITIIFSNSLVEFVLPIFKPRVFWVMVLILRKNISRRYIKCSSELEARRLWVPCASRSVGNEWSNYKGPHSPCHTHYINTKTYPAVCIQ